MGKSCAVGCTNHHFKGCGLKFYRFPVDPEWRLKWVAAVDRKNWSPNKHTWLCSTHFVEGYKSNYPTCPDYVLSVFRHLGTPKKKAEQSLLRYHVRKATRKKCAEAQKGHKAAKPRCEKAAGAKQPSERQDIPGTRLLLGFGV